MIVCFFMNLPHTRIDTATRVAELASYYCTVLASSHAQTVGTVLFGWIGSFLLLVAQFGLNGTDTGVDVLFFASGIGTTAAAAARMVRCRVAAGSTTSMM